jgi:ribonuclease HII
MVSKFFEENKLWKKGIKKVVGIDEAGRGPLAGPVTAAAVMVFKNPGLKFSGVNDSKKLSAQKREMFFELLIKDKNIKWGIGVVSEKVIDKINIKNAAELAMEKAVKKLKIKPDFLLIDGNNLKNKKLKAMNYKLIVGGDGKVFSCMAASILAKVYRDRIMMKYHQKYSQYGFDQHKGYPTALHKVRCRKYGLCPIHRRSFSF